MKDKNFLISNGKPFIFVANLYYWVYKWTPDKWKKNCHVEENTLSMIIKFSVAFEAIVQQRCTVRIILHLNIFLQFLHDLFHIHLSQWCKLLLSSYNVLEKHPSQKYKNLFQASFS